MSIADARRLNLLPKNSRGKYNNQKIVYNGKKYDSKKEAQRAFELDILLRAGHIKSWKAQPEYKIAHRGIKICSYFGDFLVEYCDGKKEVEDVKGVRTAVFILKKKLVKAFYGITIKEL